MSDELAADVLVMGAGTIGCFIGPYCGDGRIQTGNGEKCDGTRDCNNMCQPVIIF